MESFLNFYDSLIFDRVLEAVFHVFFVILNSNIVTNSELPSVEEYQW
jgi:hypothetical protein